jgi:hypothetical protein
MYTSVAMLALSGLFGAIPQERGPVWLNQYRLARGEMKKQGKPLALFFSSGQRGYHKLCSPFGLLPQDVRDLLGRKYICVYIDTSKKAGRSLARDFKLEKGIILSDQTGTFQAFRYGGKLNSQQLHKYLKQFSSPNVVVKYTATHTPTVRRASSSSTSSSPGFFRSESFGGVRCSS